MPQELSDLVQLWDRGPLLDGILTDGEAGLPDFARPFTVAGLVRRLSPLVVVLPRSRDAEAFVAALQPWVGPEVRVDLFPAWEVLPGEAMSPTLETMGRRLRTLWELAGPGAADGVAVPPTIVVTSVRAYLQQVGAPPSESLRLVPGMVMGLEEIERMLVAFGYERNYLVERPGEFSVRGGILDVYPPGAEPVRADFFGDELTSLKVFSLSSQRSHADARESLVLPVAELRLDAQTMERAAALLTQGAHEPPEPGPALLPAQPPGGGPEPDDDEAPREPARRSDLERLAAGLSFPGMEAYLATLAGPLHPPAALLAGPAGSSSSIVICDPKSCKDRAADFLAQAAEWASPEAATMFVGWEQAAGEAAVIELWPFRRAEEGIDLDVTGWDESVGQPEKLVAALQRCRAEGATVAVAGGRAAGRAKEVLADAGLGLPLASAQVGTAVMTTATVDRGFLLRFDGKPVLALVGEADLFGKRRPVVAPSQEAGARATALVLQLATGDYVVHETNGVGRYLGMVTRTVAGISRDYLLIEYAGDDRLYVPVENLNVVTKYAGGEAPRLNRLSSGDW